MNKIAAVVVTYNRLSLLKECIEALRNQTRKANTIIVINNNSTDGTDNWLDDQPDLEVIHQENVGGAGGFRRGMQEAFDRGFDWIWVMDDDVMPVLHALEKIESFFDVSQCINVTKTNKKGETLLWDFVFDYKTGQAVLNTETSVNDAKKKRYHFSNTACFEGMCISRELLQKVGLPPSEFFINGDDTLFGAIANLYTNNIFITEPLLIKEFKKGDNFGYKIGSISLNDAYYFYRNLFLIRQELKKNTSYTLPEFKKAYLKRFSRALFRAALHGRFDYVSHMCKGALDGYKGRFGKKN